MDPDSKERLVDLSGCALGVPLHLLLPRAIEDLFAGLRDRRFAGERPIKITAIQTGGSAWQVRYKSQLSTAPEPGMGALTYALDKALIVALQQRRPDLVFFHAAVLTCGQRAIALLARSGVGKSTTALAALQDGLGVRSDELAPVAVDSQLVWPYSRAICLKSNASGVVKPYSRRFRKIGERWYYPLHRGLRSPNLAGPMPLAALVCLERSEPPGCSWSQVSRGQAVARIYSHCLNPMAHPNGGLPAIKVLVGKVPVFVLKSGSVTASVRALRELFDRV